MSLDLRKTFVALATAGLLLPAVPTTAQLPILDGNPWMSRRVLNIAHRGGASEAPENTLFAYRAALASGAHMLEMDVYETADGELVAIHDATVDRTTNGSGRISDLTLAEIQALDAAHWFVQEQGAARGEPDEAYIFRGLATGEHPMPEDLAAAGVEPADFRIPTVREVLEAFPGVWKVIELKPDEEATGRFEAALASLLREFERSDDVIVASFLDHHLELFKLAAPEIHTSYPTGQVALHYVSSLGPLPGLPNRHVALQVPVTFEMIPVVDEEFVRDAHALEVAVHVWTINSCEEMAGLLAMGVDGIMNDRPSLLAGLLSQPEGEWDCSLAEALAEEEEVEPDVLAGGSPDAEPPAQVADAGPALPATGGGSSGLIGALVAAGALLLRLRGRGAL